ncbi:MAG TPA: TraR/DksA family transcriptional regulator [Actinobacteria bacterium]|nr:general stress protein 16O [bacterium BMS3Bbin02]HDL42351.1 TraR/DksA family transcriptional regulator [Actinomycetota bacterium]
MDIEAIAVELDAERLKLVHQLDELGATETGDLTANVDYGFADAASATAERSEVLSLVANIKRLLGDIDRARASIADGTYGTCAECGSEIGEARMEHRPTSRYCVRCKSQLAG